MLSKRGALAAVVLEGRLFALGGQLYTREKEREREREEEKERKREKGREREGSGGGTCFHWKEWSTRVLLQRGHLPPIHPGSATTSQKCAAVPRRART